MRHIRLLLLFLASSIATVSMAQSSDSLKMITLIEDPGLAAFEPKPEAPPVIKSNKGFRVQIYNGNDRNKASEAKMQFMKKYPGVRSYLHFHNPQYRVRVGDFATREEAEAFQETIRSNFHPTMILPDNINTAYKKAGTKAKTE